MSFSKSEIALAEAARAISAFWKTHSCKLIPNWTQNRMITYIKCHVWPFVFKKCHCLTWFLKVPAGRLVSSPFRQTLIVNPCFVIKCNVTRNCYVTAKTATQDTRLNCVIFVPHNTRFRGQIYYFHTLWFVHFYNKFLVGKVTESGGKL